MTTKACANSKCPAYAHFVYTVAMRCVLCRCDLMAAQRNAQVICLGHTDASLVQRPSLKSPARNSFPLPSAQR
jgi:hypothetical protein